MMHGQKNVKFHSTAPSGQRKSYVSCKSNLRTVSALCATHMLAYK